MLKTKMKAIYAFFAVILLAVCCFALTACGDDGTLSQEATYDKNVNYTETVSADESQNVVNAVADKVSGASENLIKGYRLTSTMKNGNGEVQMKFNMAYKDGEGMIQISGGGNEGYLYVKDGFIYAYGKKDDGTEVKLKAKYDDIASSTWAQYTSSENALNILATQLAVVKQYPSAFNVTKNGSNYKFEATIAAGSSTVVICQLGNDNAIKALHVESSSTMMSMDMTLSAFDGNLKFPNLDGYTETQNFDAL